jgi:hypothetical protein
VEAPTVRGGARRLFRVSAVGVKAVKHALATVSRMHRGLEDLLGRL